MQYEPNLQPARGSTILSLLRIVVALASVLAASRAMALAACATPWAEGNTYTLGQMVSYAGKNYKDLQPHTAWVGAGWTPPTTPALWSYVADCTTGSTGATGSTGSTGATAPTKPTTPTPPSEHKGVVPNPWTTRGYAAKQIYQRCVICGE